MRCDRPPMIDADVEELLISLSSPPAIKALLDPLDMRCEVPPMIDELGEPLLI